MLALATLHTGCGSSVNMVQRAQSNAHPDYVNDMRVITDTTLARSLRIVSINQGRASGNLLQIAATLENLKNDARPFAYKIDWIDENGMPAGDSGWRLIHLRGRETSTISAIAISPRAADFRLKIEER